jgi:hypothetical protein
MKNSIDIIDIIDIKISNLKMAIDQAPVMQSDSNWGYVNGKIAAWKELREILIVDCEEHHSDIAKQLSTVRRIVNKM